MINRKYNKSKKSIILKRTAFLLFVSSIIILIFLDINIRPVIKKVANNQGKVITTGFIDKAILQTLSDEQISYEELVIVSRNSENEIIGVEANMSSINMLKAKLSQQINNNFTDLLSFTYNIPIGTLLGSDYFVGRGPSIEFKISPTGFVQTNFASRFSSVGINQTMHQIMLEIQVQICTLLPFQQCVSTLKTEYLIAQTIIIGKVPNYYSNFLPKQEQISDNLNKYEWSDSDK
ncbi:MAG: sporulation protein YunB [Oscillospiraceae bacterium]